MSLLLITLAGVVTASVLIMLLVEPMLSILFQYIEFSVKDVHWAGQTHAKV